MQFVEFLYERYFEFSIRKITISVTLSLVSGELSFFLWYYLGFSCCLICGFSADAFEVVKTFLI